MKKLIFITITASLVLSLVSCKDGQMDNDPMGLLTACVSGYVTPPADWSKPMVYASYPRIGRYYDTAIVGPVVGGYFMLYVEQYSSVSVYLFNDANGNGSFDYRTESRLPYSGNPMTVSMLDMPPVEVEVRKITGTVEIPVAWSKPMAYLMNGWDVHSYVSLTRTNGSTLPATYSYTLYGAPISNYKVYVFNDDGGDDNANYYDSTVEGSVGYGCNPFTISGSDVTLNNLELIRFHGTITYTTGLQANSSIISSPRVALVYPYPNNNCGFEIMESFGRVNADGTYSVYGVPRNKYRLWIFNDKNANGVWNNGEIASAGAVYEDNPSDPNTDAGDCLCLPCNCAQTLSSVDKSNEDHEQFVQIPERDAVPFNTEVCYNMSATSQKQIDVTLGIISGTFGDNGHNNPQCALHQGWDMGAFNQIDSNSFAFFAVKDYSVDGGGSIVQQYTIFIYDDDYIKNGRYDWFQVGPDERDGAFDSALYTADQTGLSL